VDIDGRIAQANGRLKSSKVGIVIERRGDRLWLRGTLPPKPSADKLKPFRQKFSLGVRVTPAGIQHAEKQARLLGAELNLGKFDWANWGKNWGNDSDSESGIPCQQWIEKFEADYWNRRDRNDQSQTTWNKDYRTTFNKLPPQDVLSPELLLKVIEKTSPDSRNRKRTVRVLARLAKFAQIQVDFGHLIGSYSARRVNPRLLPSDRLIVQTRDELHHAGWQWILGMMACYGLRPHEVFLADLSEFPVVVIPDTNKTKTERFVYPLYPEWADAWKLDEKKLPAFEDLDSLPNDKRGTKISGEFYDRKIPFHAYDLRHCYARRCFEFSLPPDLAAGLMGHSVSIHINTYRAWIDRATYRRAYDALINRGDAPKPPAIGTLPGLLVTH
jgi:integrase